MSKKFVPNNCTSNLQKYLKFNKRTENIEINKNWGKNSTLPY